MNRIVYYCCVFLVFSPHRLLLQAYLYDNAKFNEESEEASNSTTKKKRKNVILIIADDLGIRDLGCYNLNQEERFYETPNLDRLASDGILFENAYSADSTCPRSRAGLFTGIHPSRLGAVDTLRLRTHGFYKEWQCFRKLTPDNKQIVPLPATTIAEAFKMNGYRTALVGKWHSGNETHGFPAEHGFDITIGNATSVNTFFAPYECGQSKCNNETILPSNLSSVPAGTFMTDHLTMDTITLLEEEFQNSEEPFFLVLSHYAVHTPIESKVSDTRHFRAKRKLLPPEGLDLYVDIDGLHERQTQDHPVYAGLLKSLDDSVGNLTDALDAMDLTNDTIILFTSDNGGKSANYNWERFRVCLTSNKPFKQAKEYIGDGGIRVPLLIKAPGQIPPNTRSFYQSHGTDYFPTLLQLVGLPLMPDVHVDGISLVPAIDGMTMVRDDPMFWQDPAECFFSSSSSKNCTDTSYAVIWNNWKLLKRIYTEDFFTLELYNIEIDPGERNNLALSSPAVQYSHVTDVMVQTLQQWEKNWFDSPFYRKISSEYGCTE